MDLHYLAVMSIMLMTEIDSGASKEGIKCYSCNSIKTPDCAQRDKSKLKQFETECDMQALLFAEKDFADNIANQQTIAPSNLGSGNNDKLDIACLKAEYTEKDSKKKVVMRYCSHKYVKDVTYCQGELTKIMKNATNVSCKQCEANLCNSSTITSPPSLLLLFAIAMPFISCLFLHKQ